MEEHASFVPLLVVVALAFLVPLLTARIRRVRIPTVVGELYFELHRGTCFELPELLTRSWSENIRYSASLRTHIGWLWMRALPNFC